MKKKLLSLLLVLGLAAGVIGCGAESDSADTKIRLGVMTGNADHWLAVIGTEQGIFQKYGIELKITEFAAGVNTVDAIVTEQSDIGMLADYALVNRIGNTQKDTNLRIITRFVSGKSSRLYVNPKEVKGLEDLSGKGVVTLPGTVWDYWNAITFEAGKVPVDKQVLLSVDSAQAGLGIMTTGEGAAFWASGTNGKKLKEAGMEVLVDMEELGLKTDQYFVSSDTYIKENAETIKKFFQALKETQEWILANKEEASKIAEKKINIPVEQFKENIKAAELVLDFKEETVEHLNGIKAWAVENGRFEIDYEVSDFADTAILKELYPDEVDY